MLERTVIEFEDELLFKKEDVLFYSFTDRNGNKRQGWLYVAEIYDSTTALCYILPHNEVTNAVKELSKKLLTDEGLRTLSRSSFI